MSSARLISLIAAWRENRLTVDEAVELNRLLRANEDARRAFRAEAEMHGLLHCAATAVAMANASELAAGTKPIGRAEGFTGWLKRNLLVATAAGLCVGIGSASAAWAIAQRPPIEAQARGIPLADPGFETSRGRVTSGFPYGPGAWSGDEAEAVERSDLPSAEGTRALRFLKAEIDARLARPPLSCDVFQLVDLRAFSSFIKAGEEATLELSADFLDTRAEPGPTARFSVAIMLFAGDPTEIHRNWPEALDDVLGAGQHHHDSSHGPTGKWHRLMARCLLPAGADFALIRLSAAHFGPVPFEFGRQFADNVKLTLKTQPHLNVRVAAAP
ncbi:MAG: hypothetical protein CK538_02135 [Opitutia bacterium]|nr:MAG: hypothetical protein CK538_02135 [Opitutae bacterium]